jgi:protein phosphatase
MKNDSSSVLGRMDKIEEKITSLNNRVSPRQKKDISETLKSSLRNCFDQITKLLKDIETIEEAEAKTFIFQRKENLMKKKMSLEKFLKESGFLGMIFDSCSDGPDGQKKLSGEKINNLFDEDMNPSNKKKTADRIKTTNMDLKAAFSIFDPLKKIGVKPDLFKKLETIEFNSSSSDSSESKSNSSDSKDDDKSDDDSTSDSSSDSLKNAFKKLDTKKIGVGEIKVVKVDETLESLLKKSDKDKKIKKDVSLESLLKKSDKDNKKIKKDSSETDDLESLLNNSDKKNKKNKKDSSEETDDLDSLLTKKENNSLFDDLNPDSTDGSSDSDSSSEEKIKINKDVKVPVVIVSDKDMSTKDFYEKYVYGVFSKKNNTATTNEREILDPSGLIRSYGVSLDMNETGLSKSKNANYRRGIRNFQLGKNNKAYEMQDTHYCECEFYNDSALFCVFDGHEGSDCSKDLVKIFPKSLKQYLKDILFDKFDDIPYLWKTLYKNVDETLKGYEYQGSTSTTALVWRNKGKRYLQCANIGDSTAFLFRNGVAIPISLDHRLLNGSGERERIISLGIKLEERADRVSGGLNVTRAFGDYCPKLNGSGITSEPYISEVFELTDKDTHVVIASDGLWDVIKSEEVFNVINNTDSKVGSHQLLHTALNNSSCLDNVTVIVISLN